MWKQKPTPLLRKNGSWSWSQGRSTGIITTDDLMQLHAFLLAATPPERGRTGLEIAQFLGVPGMSHRKADRSMQLLRRFKLARYETGWWVGVAATADTATNEETR